MSSILNARWYERPNAPPPGTRLCRGADIPDGAAQAFGFGEGRRAFAMLVVRHVGAVHGYLNVCPHFQLPLDTPARPGRFLTADGTRLKCGHHLSLFAIATGLCTDGPAEGDRLLPVPLAEADGWVVIADAAAGPDGVAGPLTPPRRAL